MTIPLKQFKTLCAKGVYCQVCRLKEAAPAHRAAWRKRFEGVPDDDQPCLFGLPWIEDEPKDGIRGLGDVIAAVTDALGIPKCDGCGKRQVALNKAVPFK